MKTVTLNTPESAIEQARRIAEKKIFDVVPIEEIIKSKAMEKSEINEKIAKVLGFKKHKANPKKGVNFVQWEYPDDWRDEICAVPVTILPDFVKMIEQSRKIADTYKYGIPKERFND